MTDIAEVADGAAELSSNQAIVLQATYDYLREHGGWPTLAAIDRPIRRAYKWNTAAIVQSLPDSVIIPPRQGLPPIASDELRLTLLGI
jgi:hypothetical protein